MESKEESESEEEISIPPKGSIFDKNDSDSETNSESSRSEEDLSDDESSDNENLRNNFKEKEQIKNVNDDKKNSNKGTVKEGSKTKSNTQENIGRTTRTKHMTTKEKEENLLKGPTTKNLRTKTQGEKEKTTENPSQSKATLRGTSKLRAEARDKKPTETTASLKPKLKPAKTDIVAAAKTKSTIDEKRLSLKNDYIMDLVCKAIESDNERKGTTVPTIKKYILGMYFY